MLEKSDKVRHIVIDAQFWNDAQNIKKIIWLFSAAELLETQGIKLKLIVSASTIAAKTGALFPELALYAHDEYDAPLNKTLSKELVKAREKGLLEIISDPKKQGGNYDLIQQIGKKILEKLGDEPLESQDAVITKLINVCYPSKEVRTAPHKSKGDSVAIEMSTAASDAETKTQLEDLERLMEAQGESLKPSLRKFLSEIKGRLAAQLKRTPSARDQVVADAPMPNAPHRPSQIELNNRKLIAGIIPQLEKIDAVMHQHNIPDGFLQDHKFISDENPNAKWVTPALVQLVMDDQKFKNLWKEPGEKPEKPSIAIARDFAVNEISIRLQHALLASEDEQVIITSKDTSEERNPLVSSIAPVLISKLAAAHPNDESLRKRRFVDLTKMNIPGVTYYSSIDKLIDDLYPKFKVIPPDNPRSQEALELVNTVGTRAKDKAEEIESPKNWRALDQHMLDEAALALARARNAIKNTNGSTNGLKQRLDMSWSELAKLRKKHGLPKYPAELDDDGKQTGMSP